MLELLSQAVRFLGYHVLIRTVDRVSRSLAEVRRRRLVRRSFAHGLLNTYELVDDCESRSTAAAA